LSSFYSACLKCKFCDEQFQVSDFEDRTDTEQEVQSEALDKEYVNAENVTDDMSVYECKNCGGEVVALNTTMATICPYCSEAISITSKSVGNFRPELCIPFAKDKKEIMELYKSYVNRSLLTPKAFKEQNTIEKIQGLFTPFYLHTITSRAQHRFEGEKSTSRKRGYDKVTTHNVYSLQIDAEGDFKRIPTDASVRVSNQLMESVEPFQYKDCKQYNPAYMAGFIAEQADDKLEDLKTRATTRAQQGMREKAKSAFAGYSMVTLKDETQTIEKHTSEYVMLPVWLLNVKYNDTRYTYAINGQTGKVVGKLPMDKLKLFLIGLGTLLTSELALTLLMMFI
jgi:DNA-directed RNA polymerase subunit RPC12/RpoP